MGGEEDQCPTSTLSLYLLWRHPTRLTARGQAARWRHAAYPLSHQHPDKVGPYLERMRTECISMVADEDQLAQLRQGVEAWNQWRDEHQIWINLRLADLAGATFGQTALGNVDLGTVRGLETVQHRGPSTIGIDTLYRSEGKIPEVFLRGAGITEDFIPYIKSLVGRPFEFYSCFISYNHTDKSFARRLHDQLQGRGIRCRLGEHQMLPGDDIYEQIDRGIRLWDKVLLCCSQASLTSWWVDNGAPRSAIM